MGVRRGPADLLSGWHDQAAAWSPSVEIASIVVDSVKVQCLGIQKTKREKMQGQAHC